MSVVVQYDFWKSQEESEMDALRHEMAAVKASSEKVRRALFARNGELTKRMLDLEYRLEVLERNICKS